MILQLSKQPSNYFRFLFNVQKILQNYVPSTACTTSIVNIDVLTTELLQRHKTKSQISRQIFGTNIFNLKCSKKNEHNDFLSLTVNITQEELKKVINELVTNNKDQELLEVMLKSEQYKQLISENTLKTLLNTYSLLGKTVMVQTIINYCERTNAHMYKRNGEFLHYLAKAQCMKGNSEKGLEILKNCYGKYECLRSIYRVIFKELIQDSVLNRSEASMVIFKKNILEFSERWNDHYPLIFMWHICWMSSWFSDQMLANELFDNSNVLRNIVKDKAMVFSVSALRNHYNEDSVVRLLQLLLKHEMMTEYVKVLQVLFCYKLKNRDIRGCSEILKNCEVLGVNLSPVQQGQFIRMLIEGKTKPSKPQTFKLKF